MGVAARSLLIQLLLPLAAVCATVSLRLTVAAERLLLWRAALPALMGVLLAAGLSGRRGRLNYVRLPTLVVQLSGQFAEIGPERLAKNRIRRVHRHIHRSGAIGYANRSGRLIVVGQV